jgi:hypothetical protein
VVGPGVVNRIVRQLLATASYRRAGSRTRIAVDRPR